MKHFEIYFEIYGKKMKTTVHAQSKHEAMNLVRNKINFVKIKPKFENDDVVNNLKDIFGMF